MKNLVIGNTSQLSHYFPIDYEKISSRNIDFQQYENNFYDRIYLTFAEQRTYIENDLELFTDTNVDYTKKIIDFFKDRCNKIVWFSTIELWNNHEGEITLDTPYNYNYTPYIKSKEMMSNYIKENYSNVIIIYPVNFNSIHRKGNFLFSKIFDSLLNNTKIEIGDTNFERDILHPKFIVIQSIIINNHTLVGSGHLININEFIKGLYKNMGMNYNEYVKENNNNNLSTKRKTFYTNSPIINTEKIIIETINEIKTNKISK